MLQLSQCLGFNLANAFTRYRELLANFFQRMVGVHADAEAHAQHALFARCQRGEHAGCCFAQVALNGGIQRQNAFLSSMKSPRCESSSSPIGVSRLIGSLAIFITLRTFSSGICSFLGQFFRRRLAADFVQHLARLSARAC